jgi:hypothetical protein
VSDDRWGFVVNRAQRADLTPADVERAFGVPPFAVIPSDGTVPRAQQRGRLIPPKGRAGRAVARLAASLRTEPADTAAG